MVKFFGKKVKLFGTKKCNKNGECCTDCNNHRRNQLLHFRIKSEQKFYEEQEKLTHRIVHLQRANEKLQKKLHNLKKSCPVCLEKYKCPSKRTSRSAMLLAPCGHCMCTGCLHQMVNQLQNVQYQAESANTWNLVIDEFQDLRCPVCRKDLLSALPLFM